MTPDAPQVPQPPPKVAVGQLWACLLLHPVAIVLLALPFIASNQSVAVALFLILAIIVLGAFTIWFAMILRVRYSGASLALMTAGYFFGQIILVAGLVFGACLILFMQF